MIDKLTATNSSMDKYFNIEFIVRDYCDGLSDEELKERLDS